MGPTSLRQRLRTETAPSHRALETELALMDPEIGLSRYRNYLRAVWRVHRPLEQALTASRSLRSRLPDLPERLRTDALVADLSALGAEPVDPPELDYLDGDAALLGAAYVFEGSSLGALRLLPHLEACLGLRSAGLDYLRAYGPRTGPLWKAFVAALAQPLSETDGADRAVASATATFDAVRREFSALEAPCPS